MNISFANIEANRLLAEMDGVAASAGAACHSDSVQISTTISALKVPMEFAMGTIRFSTGKMTTNQEIDKALTIIENSIKKFKL